MRTGTLMGLLAGATLALAPSASRAEGPWIRAGIDTEKPIWGLREGIMVGIWPAAIEGDSVGGPRGLIRVGYPLGEPRIHRLVNFIAVEPDMNDGHWRGLSELEPSALDGVPGKRFTAEMPPGSASPVATPGLPPGEIDHPDDNPEAERLRVLIRVEPFDNGAHAYLVLSLRTDRPDELTLETYQEPDSVPIHELVLTATMGNHARLRQAHLGGGGILDARQVWPDYQGDGFAPMCSVPLARLARTSDGGVIVPMACDEAEPARNWPYDAWIHWRWPWEKTTQYWRKPAGTVGEDLLFRANGRVVYWAGQLPIPGGIAYENAELGQTFRSGDPFVFGVTRRTPAELLAE